MYLLGLSIPLVLLAPDAYEAVSDVDSYPSSSSSSVAYEAVSASESDDVPSAALVLGWNRMRDRRLEMDDSPSDSSGLPGLGRCRPLLALRVLFRGGGCADCSRSGRPLRDERSDRSSSSSPS